MLGDVLLNDWFSLNCPELTALTLWDCARVSQDVKSHKRERPVSTTLPRNESHSVRPLSVFPADSHRLQDGWDTARNECTAKSLVRRLMSRNASPTLATTKAMCACRCDTRVPHSCIYYARQQCLRQGASQSQFGQWCRLV